MKKIILLILAFGFVIAVFNYRANSDIPGIIDKLNAPINKAQSSDLAYKVYLFNLIPIAEAVVKSPKAETYSGKKALHLAMEAATTQNIAFLFKGNVKLDSYLDPKTGNPVYFRQELFTSNHGQKIKEVYYDQAAGVMALNGVRRVIFPDTQDFLSLVYGMGKFDFTKNPRCKFYINTNQKNYVFLGAAALKPVRKGRKTYDLLNLQAQIRREDKNNPYHRTNLGVYMFEGVPVYIRVVASGILITARLYDIRQ
ncbi:MAG: DUF3108 domain-containing protein [Candidatus Omnitrophica bacterium]|jgi:hypothetical protein|nr:DUF3108 domain-containing protein [Candidatus Omnitrophota bacterium]